VPERQILLRHSFRNALLPMKITIAGLHVPNMLSGALVTAAVVTWPGMGRLFLDSIGYRDDPVVMGILMFSAILVLVGSLLADLLYGVADPRISRSGIRPIPPRRACTNHPCRNSLAFGSGQVPAASVGISSRSLASS
jgi:peptide/nickel transport system permease protein